MSLVPMVIEQTNRGERSYDIFSLRGEIHADETADRIV